MTTLEIILIAIIWIVYGIYAAVRTHGNLFSKKSDFDEVTAGVFIVIFAPLVLIYRAIYGIFQSY